MIPERKWKWSGIACHFICGSRCRFHMGTVVGKYLISTVGEMLDEQRRGSLRTDEFYGMAPEYCADIGYQRKYETMVFRLKQRRGKNRSTCDCLRCRYDQMDQVDFLPANTAGEAERNHMKLCRKWARKGDEKK